MRNLAKSFSKSDGKSSCYPQTMSSGQHIVASFTDIAEDTDMALEDLESRLSISTQEKFFMPGLLRKRWNGGSWRGSL